MCFEQLRCVSSDVYESFHFVIVKGSFSIMIMRELDNGTLFLRLRLGAFVPR